MPYKLPSNLAPDEVECIRVYVPKDTEWRSLFWGAFSELARWFNYELDGSHAAADVAKVWRNLFLLSEDDYGKGCEMAIDMRVKPGYPNISQISTDGGVSWHDFLIQPTWLMGQAVSTWPTVNTDDEAASVAGGITSGGPIHFAERVIEMDGDSLSRDTIANNLYAEFARFNPLPSAFPLFRPMVDLILDAPTPTAYANECTYDTFWNELKDFLRGEPNSFGQGLSNWLFNWAQTADDEIIGQFADLYATIAGNDAFYNYLADHESLRKDTFGEYCGDGCERLLLTTDQHGWGIVSAGGRTFGGWTNGVGFYTINDGNANSPVIIMQTDMTGTPITHAEFYIEFTGPWTNLSIQLVDLNGGGSPSEDLIDMGGNIWAVDVAWTITGNLRLVIQDLDNPNTGQAVVSQFCIV